MQISWTCKEFNSLTVRELYDAIQLRNEVFIVEQRCIFQDVDSKDLFAYHILGYDSLNPSRLVAYARLFAPGDSYDYPSISRVVNSPEYRGKGIGKALIAKAIETIYSKYGIHPVKIGAQNYLRKLYESYGFEVIGEVYLEDEIEHVEMIKQPTLFN